MLSSEGRAKLIDLGLCVQFKPHGWTKVKAGKRLYFAPEVTRYACTQLVFLPIRIIFTHQNFRTILVFKLQIFTKKMVRVSVVPTDDICDVANKITALTNLPAHLQE